MKFNFVQGMPNVSSRGREDDAEEKQWQEAAMMRRRLESRGPEAIHEYENMPLNGANEDDPETHQRLMARGREMAGPWDGIDQVAGATVEAERNADRHNQSSGPWGGSPAGGGGRDGIDQIGDYASQLLARARAQSRQRGGGRR